MKRTLRDIAVFVAMLGIGALLFAWSGLYNVAATQKHLAVTAWFLEFAMMNSVELHSRKIKPPPLDDLSLVLRGAGHYEGGCAPCHGAPERPRNPIPLRMLPQPPHLAKAERWSDAELYWIVKHGIKYAGMPGWVAPERDDEVWAVVAFLRRLKDLSAQEYRRLAFGEVAEVARAAPESRRLLALAGPIGGAITACARCHGLDGEGRGVGAFPRLSIQNAEYIYQALKAYGVGGRPSGIMQPVAVGLSDPEMRALATYYAEVGKTGAVLAAEDVDQDVLRLGRAIALEGRPSVPACLTCHGGQDSRFPVLAGQYADYLALQLKLFRAGIRGGPNGVVMSSVAQLMTDEEIRAVSLYYSTLRPDPAAPPLARAAPPPGEEARQ